MEKFLVTAEYFDGYNPKKYHSGMDVKIGDYIIYCYVNALDGNMWLTKINEQEIGEKYDFVEYRPSNNLPVFNEK